MWTLVYSTTWVAAQSEREETKEMLDYYPSCNEIQKERNQISWPKEIPIESRFTLQMRARIVKYCRHTLKKHDVPTDADIDIEHK